MLQYNSTTSQVREICRPLDDNPKSQIRVRVLTWQKDTIDGDFFARRLRQAYDFRRRHLSTVTSAYRIVNGEGDFLPGLIVDRYGDYLVLMPTSLAMAQRIDVLASTLRSLVQPKGMVLRTDPSWTPVASPSSRASTTPTRSTSATIATSCARSS